MIHGWGGTIRGVLRSAAVLAALQVISCAPDASTGSASSTARTSILVAKEPTSELLIFLQPGTDPAGFARDHGLTHRKTLKSDPDAHVFASADPLGVLAARGRARADARVRRAYLNERLHKVKCDFVPNDPYYTNGNPSGFKGQWHLSNGAVPVADIHITGAWKRDYTGQGVVFGIVDDGLEHTHPDLAPNYVAADSWDFGQNDGDPSPVNNVGQSEDRHGTCVGGVAAARGGNGIGGTGAAPFAGLSGCRIDFNNQTTQDFVDATLFHASGGNTNVKIKNHSYGYSVPYVDDQPERDAVATSAAAAAIHLYAAGNERGTTAQDSNKQDLPSSPDVIAVAAFGSTGKFSSYSSFGANVFVTTPSNTSGGLGITTTDRVGSNGYNRKSGGFSDGDSFPNLDYTSTFGGTSSATPLAAGVLALVKQAQPNLNVRFAKHLLARTCRKVDSTDNTVTGGGDGSTSGSAWITNGALLNFNQNYGFGLIDAEALTLNALEYTGVTSVSGLTPDTETKSGSPGLAIPNNNAVGVSQTFLMAKTTPLEEVLVTLDISHPSRGDVEAILKSPMGTSCRLFINEPSDTAPDINWTFISNAFWGENPSGTWTLTVRDVVSGNTGTWNSYSVTTRMGQLVPKATPPVVASIVRADPDPTAAASVNFTVKFSRIVTGVDAGDFVLTTTGAISGASISGVTGSYDTYTVTVNTGTLDGTIRLDVVDDDSIQDMFGHKLGGAGAGNGNFNSGEVYTIDKSLGTVTQVRSTSSNGTYGLGDVVNVTVDFSEAATLSGGNLQVTLDTGAVVSIPPFAAQTSVSATYTVGPGENSPDLNAVSPLTLSGGTLVDSMGGAFSLAIPAGKNIADSKNIVIDTTGPGVTQVSSTKSNGIYGLGTAIPITVTFSEPVFVTGTPRLTVETGAVDEFAPYSSGSGTTVLTFTYTVAAGDVSTDLDLVSAAALALNGGTIKDGVGNNASLALPTPGAAGSLGANKDLIIDTTAPVAGTVSDGWSGPDLSTQTSTTTISAHWTGFGDPESGVTGYEWAIGTSPGATNVRNFSSVGLQTQASTSAVNVTLSLSIGSTYYVTVRATNGAGLTTTVSSDGVTITGSDSVPPTAPPMFTALAENQAVLLEWLPSTSPDVATYRIWWKPSSAAWTSATLIDGLTVLTTTVSGLTNGTSYDFMIKALDTSGNESSGVFASAVPVPAITIDGLGSYGTIQNAINAAVGGDTVTVGPGAFAETLTLKAGVSLCGASPKHTIITGSVTVSGTYTVDPTSVLCHLTITGGAVGIAGGSADVAVDHVIVHGAAGHAISSGAAGRLKAVNCTLIANGGDGVNVAGGATASTIRNCVVAKNTGTGINVPSSSAATYNDVYGNSPDFGAGVSGTGNLSTAAVFVDEPGNNYIEDPTSPTIDTGGPSDAFSQEPAPNGSRINQGAFGDTPWATSLAGLPVKKKGGGGGGCGATGLEALLLVLLARHRRRR